MCSTFMPSGLTRSGRCDTVAAAELDKAPIGGDAAEDLGYDPILVALGVDLYSRVADQLARIARLPVSAIAARTVAGRSSLEQNTAVRGEVIQTDLELIA
jgi:hypothetical protein